MIYKFRIVSDEVDDFVRDIEIDSKSNFEQFHTIIQQSVCYEPWQLASFFQVDHTWKKGTEITLLDMGLGITHSVPMNKAILKDYVQSKNQKLIYVFDFFQDRNFFIELIEIFMERNLEKPTVAYAAGEAPLQMLEDDFTVEQAGTNLLDDPLQSSYDFGDLDDYNEIFGEMLE
ncbi:hypothetical protein EYV94_07170 [Puteibacter caeruleilacunae]|nr:hypothetical protein EYV94_07170 [Puteibacter caeruleilacunae]